MDNDIKTELGKARNTKSTRLWFIILVFVGLVALYMMGFIKKGFAIGLGIIILAAIGIETFNYDLDLSTLWKTGDIQESRVEHTKDGTKLMGSCVRADVDCKDFKTQEEAQAKYDTCANQVASYNIGKSAADIKNLDIYGLDGNKNGVVCESLPRLKTAM